MFERMRDTNAPRPTPEIVPDGRTVNIIVVLERRGVALTAHAAPSAIVRLTGGC